MGYQWQGIDSPETQTATPSTTPACRGIDGWIKLDALTAAKQTATSYCISATVGGKTWYKASPGATISTTAG